MVGIIRWWVVGGGSLAVGRSSVAVRRTFFVRNLVAGSFRGYRLAEPIFDRYSHLLKSAFEEVISGFNADQLLRIGEAVDERFEFAWRAKLIPRAADEEFGLGASAQKFEIVEAAFDGDGGQAEGDERADAVV